MPPLLFSSHAIKLQSVFPVYPGSSLVIPLLSPRLLRYESNKHDLFKAYEVENIIHCAAMSALASKERKESRWGLWHMRSDYPMKDDEHWMQHIVLKQGDSFDDIRISYAPIIKM